MYSRAIAILIFFKEKNNNFSIYVKLIILFFRLPKPPEKKYYPSFTKPSETGADIRGAHGPGGTPSLVIQVPGPPSESQGIPSFRPHRNPATSCDAY